MNYQDYDEYMRSLIGYPNMRTSMSPSMFPMEAYSDDLERMYPEVYRVVYPMVCFACDNIRTPVTEEMLDMASTMTLMSILNFMGIKCDNPQVAKLNEQLNKIQK